MLAENLKVPEEDSQESDETKKMRQVKKILIVPEQQMDNFESTMKRVSTRQCLLRCRSKASNKYERTKNEVLESSFLSVPLKYLRFSMQKSPRKTYVSFPR